MSNPTVAAVMLVNGRPEMVKRAIASFQAQTYQEKKLLIWDSGVTLPGRPGDMEPNIRHIGWPQKGLTVGALRNMANSAANADIILHMDSDDVSHPCRIAEQVALLQASGKECVGYRDMLFWHTKQLAESDVYGFGAGDEPCDVFDEAWIYTNGDTRYALGTSLCYWRKTWERRPFPDAPKAKGATAEDTLWLREVDSLGVSMMGGAAIGPNAGYCIAPCMIASIHGENTSDYPYSMQDTVKWKRAPAWDDYCRARMSLEGK